MIYLYCHVPRGTTAPASTGVADAPVELLPCGDAAAVVSEVSAQEFSAEAIEARLQDLDWVGQRGVEHERVVAELVDRVTVLPARLFTLFSSREALAEDCRDRGEWIAERLERLSGLREWDLKISCDLERFARHVSAHSPEVAQLERELAEAAPGRRYLLQRKVDDLASREARRAAAGVAGEVFDQVSGVARASRRLEPPARPSDGSLPVVLYAALLVEREREQQLSDELRRAAEPLEPEGFGVAFSGPWAPYRFLGES